MNDVGKILQQARKKKRYSLDKIHKITKIKEEYIAGLENNNVSVFPAELYYKNFLKTYANFLGLDTEEIMKTYEQSKLEQQQDLFKQQNNNTEHMLASFGKKYSKLIITISSFFIIFICLLISNMFINKNSSQNSDMLSVGTEQTVEKEEPQKKQKQSLYIKAVSNTWIKITADNRKIFEDTLYKNKTYKASADDSFVIKIGDINGIQVYFNDTPVNISKGAGKNKVNTIILKRS